MLPMVTNDRKQKIVIAQIPLWTRFLPDVHNRRCCSRTVPRQLLRLKRR